MTFTEKFYKDYYNKCDRMISETNFELYWYKKELYVNIAGLYNIVAFPYSEENQKSFTYFFVPITDINIIKRLSKKQEIKRR